MQGYRRQPRLTIVRLLLPLALCIASSLVAGCERFGEPSAQVPTPEELQKSASAREGAFAAADEVCVGEGGLAESLARAIDRGWKAFEPAEGSMMSRLRQAYLEGGDVPRPDVVLLRKDRNRAQILLFQLTTLRGTRYIHNCDVIEQAAEGLDEEVLRSWAAVPVEARQIGDSPVSFDLKGGRFASNVSASAYFVPRGGTGDWPAEGLIVSFMRSNRPAGQEE
mgnify:CR=1 FL=1